MSGTRTLPCPINGCSNYRLPNHVMCQQCWHTVPKADRNRVWDEYTNAHGTRSHAAAITSAITAAELSQARREVEA